LPASYVTPRLPEYWSAAFFSPDASRSPALYSAPTVVVTPPFLTSIPPPAAVRPFCESMIAFPEIPTLSLSSP